MRAISQPSRPKGAIYWQIRYLLGYTNIDTFGLKLKLLQLK